jgi:Zn-dependent M28 family amino/carboxypeptidase
MMGKDAMFPGASDNASGTSMILYLANYYSKYKPKDNIVFILFSGEEAGLMGSSYFTSHPTFDIQKIKMLVNIDIMGNADKGITVVNGEVYKPQFDLLTRINKKGQYLPEIKIRGKAKNSDHYYFSEKGIPAFFIYSNGGKGYYHDIYDKADQLELTNYEQVAKLLIEFASKI